MLNIYPKHFNLIDRSSFFIYYESNTVFFSSYLGMIKLKFNDSICFFMDDLWFTYLNTSFFNSLKFRFYILQWFNRIGNYLTSILFGLSLKYKVIGLGHRGYYSNNLYLFKIGYSHLVFSFLNLSVKAKKKKKKKLFHKLYSINNNILSNTFFHLQNLRVPDIYSSNGIFNRTDYYLFKKGKKSFML